MYQLLPGELLGAASSIQRIEDQAIIPADPENTDYANYLQWLAAGNTPQSAALPQATPAEQIDALERLHMLPRPVRDVMLGLMEKEAAALGVTPEQLRVVNAGYRKVKELDEQIAALRGLL